MKKYSLLYIFTGLLIFVSSCSNTIYFTKEIRYELYRSNLSITKVQFYNSRKIVLKRNLSYAETKLARGKIKLENGQYIEEIIIPDNTPGVATGQGKNYLNVAFENGRNRELKFKLNTNNYFQLSPEGWNNNSGKVVYDTLIYVIENGSEKALLKVKKDIIYNFQLKKRIVKGKTIGK